MKAATKCHLLGGLCTIMLASLVGAVDHKGSAHEEQSVIRSYRVGAVHWDADGLNESESGDSYECSDGRRLYGVRYDFVSPKLAIHALNSRLKGARSLANAETDVAEVTRAGDLFIIRMCSPSRLKGASNEDGLTTEALWLIGHSVYSIYGPTRDHVLELYGANPGRRWGILDPTAAPN